ncbi:nucleotide disphospho-sugar-binding domain-containing protein [Kitasatospora sp. NPDC056446]|uniref:nucleotide disphospho-sugar-binding domain-containing protein n=1 Tax=Kitasatospora sp. NPDC056446 TaxID=3345819 RepID=UPI0036746100
MRVLFTTVDWTGHLYPMVPLGWALQAAGHQVRVLCSSGVARAAEQAGLVPLPLLENTGVVQARMNNHLRAREGLSRAGGLPPVHPLTGRPMGSLDEFDLDGFLRGAAALNSRWLERRRRLLEDLATGWRPDLVVHDLASLDGRVVADRVGVPAVAHLWGLVADAETDDRMDYRPERIDADFARFELRGTGAEVRHLVDPTPDALAPPTRAARLATRFVPYNGPGGLPARLLRDPLPPAGRRRICVVWGTSVTRVYGPDSFLVPRLVEALRGLPDVEAVLAVTAEDAARIGGLPENVRLLEQTPLHLLLPACHAVVHNGAAGSAMTALAAGVPQLAVAVSDEQYGNGARIAAAGAGLVLDGPGSTPQELRDALRRLVDDPGLAATADRIGRENAARPAPAALVPRLEALAAGTP